MASSEEKLKKLLDEGKITFEQYIEMRKDIQDSPHSYIKSENIHLNQEKSSRFSGLPWQIWVCSIFLFIVATIHILMGFHPELMLLGAFEIALGIGLLYKNKWAYILLVILFVTGTVALLIKADVAKLFKSLIINLPFIIILISAYESFFPGLSEKFGK